MSSLINTDPCKLQCYCSLLSAKVHSADRQAKEAKKKGETVIIEVILIGYRILIR